MKTIDEILKEFKNNIRRGDSTINILSDYVEFCNKTDREAKREIQAKIDEAVVNRRLLYEKELRQKVRGLIYEAVKAERKRILDIAQEINKTLKEIDAKNPAIEYYGLLRYAMEGADAIIKELEGGE